MWLPGGPEQEAVAGRTAEASAAAGRRLVGPVMSGVLVGRKPCFAGW